MYKKRKKLAYEDKSFSDIDFDIARFSGEMKIKTLGNASVVTSLWRDTSYSMTSEIAKRNILRKTTKTMVLAKLQAERVYCIHKTLLSNEGGTVLSSTIEVPIRVIYKNVGQKMLYEKEDYKRLFNAAVTLLPRLSNSIWSNIVTAKDLYDDTLLVDLSRYEEGYFADIMLTMEWWDGTEIKSFRKAAKFRFSSAAEFEACKADSFGDICKPVGFLNVINSNLIEGNTTREGPANSIPVNNYIYFLDCKQ